MEGKMDNMNYLKVVKRSCASVQFILDRIFSMPTHGFSIFFNTYSLNLFELLLAPLPYGHIK